MEYTAGARDFLLTEYQPTARGSSISQTVFATISAEYTARTGSGIIRITVTLFWQSGYRKEYQIKNLCLFVITFGAAAGAFAACPNGYGEIDNAALYVVIRDQDSCPPGYSEIPDNALLLPSGGICDAAKGACNSGGVCLAP
jgi:hypothetical protein